MRDELLSALGVLHRCIGDLEAARLTTGDAAELVKLFAQVERIGVSGKLLVAARAAEGFEWAQFGHRSPASWLADVSGTSIGEAIGCLETSVRLGELPETTGVVRQGTLSAPQAREIAAAGSVDPGAEAALLESAANTSFKELREDARRVRAAAAAGLAGCERERRIRQARYLRSWTDHDGAFRLDAKMTPVDGAQVLATLEERARAHFREARAAGVAETEAAYLADALVSLCANGGDKSGGGRKGPRAMVHLRVDLAALHRWSLEPGELCEIPGVGSIELATAQSVMADSFVKLFVTDGINVQTVVHHGRTIPAAVRSALEERDPCCVVPGCRATKFLEIDHWAVPFAQGGPSCLENLARICPHHHQLKTSGAFQLVGGPGYWQFRRVPQAPADGCSSGNDPPRTTEDSGAALLPV